MKTTDDFALVPDSPESCWRAFAPKHPMRRWKLFFGSMVVSGLPHHLTQRGNRRAPMFFGDGDQECYRDLIGEQAHKADVAMRSLSRTKSVLFGEAFAANRGLAVPVLVRS